jgi:hypothetical protein
VLDDRAVRQPDMQAEDMLERAQPDPVPIPFGWRPGRDDGQNRIRAVRP